MADVKKSYLAKKNSGRISILYMVEEGPDSIADKVLSETGWATTNTVTDWRFGERSDIEEVSQEEARWFAERLGFGEFVK